MDPSGLHETGSGGGLTRKFLVTGGTGFLGSHLVERLKAQAAEDPGSISIRVLCRRSSRWEGDPNIEVVYGDILDPEAVDRAVAGVAGIYHLAGVVARNPANAAQLYDIHIQGTRNICRSALAFGRPKIVIASSSGTVAVSRHPIMHNEGSPYANDIVARWPYYLSKIYQEKLALSYYEYYNLPVVIVSPGLLLGPGDFRLSSTGDIKIFLDGYLRSLPSGGLNFVDVRDAADAFIRAMDAGIPGRKYLVGGHNMSIKEFSQLVGRAAGVSAPRLQLSEKWSRRGLKSVRRLYRSVGRAFPLEEVTLEMAYRFWYIDNRRAQSELGFKPRAAEETIRDTVEFLRRVR